MKVNDQVEWILRIGIFGTFFGHGVFALLGKQSWLPLFAPVGISAETAAILLPLIGILDIIVAILALVKPYKSILLWATTWAFATALIRPFAGDPIWDFVERTANWAAPLALLALHGLPKKFNEWWKV